MLSARQRALPAALPEVVRGEMLPLPADDGHECGHLPATVRANLLRLVAQALDKCGAPWRLQFGPLVEFSECDLKSRSRDDIDIGIPLQWWRANLGCVEDSMAAFNFRESRRLGSLSDMVGYEMTYTSPKLSGEDYEGELLELGVDFFALVDLPRCQLYATWQGNAFGSWPHVCFDYATGHRRARWGNLTVGVPMPLAASLASAYGRHRMSRAYAALSVRGVGCVSYGLHTSRSLYPDLEPDFLRKFPRVVRGPNSPRFQHRTAEQNLRSLAATCGIAVGHCARALSWNVAVPQLASQKHSCAAPAGSSLAKRNASKKVGHEAFRHNTQVCELSLPSALLPPPAKAQMVPLLTTLTARKDRPCPRNGPNRSLSSPRTACTTAGNAYTLIYLCASLLRPACPHRIPNSVPLTHTAAAQVSMVRNESCLPNAKKG